MDKPKKKRFEPFGRPTKYKPEYCQAIIDFFSISPTTKVPHKYFTDNEGNETLLYKDVANTFPTIEGFCQTIDIVKETLHLWVKKHQDFMAAYQKARQLQENIWVQNSLAGLFNPAFTIFLGKNVFKWTDKTQVEHGNIEDNDLKVSFVAPQLAEKIEHAEVLELPDEIKQIESKPLDEADDTLPGTSKIDSDID